MPGHGDEDAACDGRSCALWLWRCAGAPAVARRGFDPPQPQPADPVAAARENPDMPADADPYYSTPKATDDDVDFKTTTRKTITDPRTNRRAR